MTGTIYKYPARAGYLCSAKSSRPVCWALYHAGLIRDIQLGVFLYTRKFNIATTMTTMHVVTDESHASMTVTSYSSRSLKAAMNDSWVKRSYMMWLGIFIAFCEWSNFLFFGGGWVPGDNGVYEKQTLNLHIPLHILYLMSLQFSTGRVMAWK